MDKDSRNGITNGNTTGTIKYEATGVGGHTELTVVSTSLADAEEMMTFMKKLVGVVYMDLEKQS